MHCIVNTDCGKVFTTYWCTVCDENWVEAMEEGDEIYCGELKTADEEGWETTRRTVEGASGSLGGLTCPNA